MGTWKGYISCIFFMHTSESSCWCLCQGHLLLSYCPVLWLPKSTALGHRPMQALSATKYYLFVPIRNIIIRPFSYPHSALNVRLFRGSPQLYRCGSVCARMASKSCKTMTLSPSDILDAGSRRFAALLFRVQANKSCVLPLAVNKASANASIRRGALVSRKGARRQSDTLQV